MKERGQMVSFELLLEGREAPRESIEQVRGFAGMFGAIDALGPLDREITLPSGTIATAADLMAAAAYIQYQDAYGPTKGRKK